MDHLLCYNNKDNAVSVYIHDINAAHAIARAMKNDGWTVVWMIHTTDEVRPQVGYAKAYDEWKKLIS